MLDGDGQGRREDVRGVVDSGRGGIGAGQRLPGLVDVLQDLLVQGVLSRIPVRLHGGHLHGGRVVQDGRARLVLPTAPIVHPIVVVVVGIHKVIVLPIPIRVRHRLRELLLRWLLQDLRCGDCKEMESV